MNLLKIVITGCIIGTSFTSKCLSQSKDNPPISKRSQAIYLNLGGSSPLIALHYDRRLFKKANGAGFSIGAGYYGGLGSPTISVPVAVNYLIGKKNHFVEIAAGTTYISERRDFFDDGKSGGGLIEFANAGYRFQHKKGLLFRAGVSPVIVRRLLWSAYLGIGVAF